MAGATVTMTLPQMIDCAINSPENGSINFLMLHSLLQVLVQQLELLSCNVEFKGKEGDIVKTLLEASKSTPKVTLKEFVVTPPKDAGKRLNRGKKDQEKDPNAVHIDDVEKSGELKTVVVVERDGVGSDSQALVITKEEMEGMQREIKELKNHFKELSEMPANQTLINAIRQAEGGKGAPILEIFQSVSLTKRVDAADSQLQKLGVMLEDLIKSNPNLGCPPGLEGAESLCDRLKMVDDRISRLEQALAGGGVVLPSVENQPHPQPTTAAPSAPTQSQEPSEPAPSTDVTDFTHMDLDEFKKAVAQEFKDIKEDIKKLHDSLSGIRAVFQQVTVEDIVAAAKGKKRMKKDPSETESGEPEPAGTADRLDEMESFFQEITQQIASLDTTFNNEFQNLQAQFAEMEKEFGSIMEKIHVGSSLGEGQVSGETVGELYEKIIGIQTDMESLADTASKLMEDKEQKEKLMDLLTEQIDMLKTIKADKEDLEDALADKADACAINRKVSHDQFDTACDELSKGIEEALAKLTQQEQLWQAALDEIQREIGNKLDRMELGPLRDFINQKLKILQQKLKALTALKQENEAAGTKKFLKNVQCISCDKDVVMRKELDPSVLPQPYALPPTKSMGPYLAYELDALRKQQKALPNSRNLNHFESALHSKSPRTGEDHICNRYCGGSHTITTPQQRVTRLGHFLNQWGPEAQPVSDTTKEDESPLVITGRGAERQSSAKIPKDGPAGDAPQPKESKERRGSADKKPVAAKGSKTSGGSKTSQPKVSPKASPTTKPAAAKKPSQTSNKSVGSAAKQGSKTSAPNIPEQIPEETTEEHPPSEAGGEPATAEPEAPTGTPAEATETPAETAESAPEPPPSEPSEPAEAPTEAAAEDQPEEAAA